MERIVRPRTPVTRLRTALRGVALALPPLVPLPLTLAPPAPFPLMTSAAATRAFVAPGVSRADYIVRTSSGPLAIHVVAFDPREPTLRITTVLAHDRLASEGETVSSMARRTGAVAGINADYFESGTRISRSASSSATGRWCAARTTASRSP